GDRQVHHRSEGTRIALTHRETEQRAAQTRGGTAFLMASADSRSRVSYICAAVVSLPPYACVLPASVASSAATEVWAAWHAAPICNCDTAADASPSGLSACNADKLCPACSNSRPTLRRTSGSTFRMPSVLLIAQSSDRSRQGGSARACDVAAWEALSPSDSHLVYRPSVRAAPRTAPAVRRLRGPGLGCCPGTRPRGSRSTPRHGGCPDRVRPAAQPCR